MTRWAPGWAEGGRSGVAPGLNLSSHQLGRRRSGGISCSSIAGLSLVGAARLRLRLGRSHGGRLLGRDPAGNGLLGS